MIRKIAKEYYKHKGTVPLCSIETTIEKFKHFGGNIIVKKDDGFELNPSLNWKTKKGFTILGIENSTEISSRDLSSSEFGVTILGVKASLGFEGLFLKGGLSVGDNGFKVAAGFNGNDIGAEGSLSGKNIKNTLRLGMDWDGISLSNRSFVSTDEVGEFVKTWTETTVNKEMWRLRFNMRPVVVVSGTIGLVALGLWLWPLLGGIGLAGVGASASILTILLSKLGLDKLMKIRSSQNCDIS